MPTKKGRGKGPTYGNPPSLRECFAVDGHGIEPAHISEEGGFVTIKQGQHSVRFPSSCSPAFRAALERLEGSDLHWVFERKYRNIKGG